MENTTRRTFVKNSALATALVTGSILAGSVEAAKAESASVDADSFDYASAFCSTLDANDLKYQQADDHTIKVAFAGENTESIEVIFYFDEDGNDYCALRSWNIYEYKNSQLSDAFALCNEMNKTYRWISFYIDSDNEVAAKCDAILSADTCGDELLDLLIKTVNIIDEAYLTFAAIG